MRCNACWREARKTAAVTGARTGTLYRVAKCDHDDRKHTRMARPELALRVTLGPLTPLHELFPEMARS